jgi:hypothetical protein
MVSMVHGLMVYLFVDVWCMLSAQILANADMQSCAV